MGTEIQIEKSIIEKAHDFKDQLSSDACSKPAHKLTDNENLSKAVTTKEVLTPNLGKIKEWICPNCDHKFKSRQHLREHISSRHDKKIPYRVIDKSFVLVDSMKHHDELTNKDMKIEVKSKIHDRLIHKNMKVEVKEEACEDIYFIEDFEMKPMNN